VAIEFFENIEYTSIEMFINGIDNTGNGVTFFFLPLDLISQRRLIGYVFTASFLDGISARREMCYSDAQITIIQPLNQSRFPPLSSTVPVGGSVTSTTNEIHLPGNAGQVSIIPVDIKEFRLVIELSDQLATGFPVTAHLALFWDRSRTRSLKFVGED